MRISDWSSDVCSSDLLPDPTDGPLCRCPVADALDRPALHHPLEHGDTARIDGDEHPPLPAYDLLDQTIGGQSLAHRIAQHRELDPVHAHDVRAAQLETFVQIADRAPVLQGGATIGSATVRTPVTTAHLDCRLL